MASTIEIFRGTELIGHFSTHLDTDECVANIESDSMGAFADWSGEFAPTDAEEWSRDENNMEWRQDGEPFYRFADGVGDIAEGVA
jgi:hypothetical protein